MLPEPMSKHARFSFQTGVFMFRGSWETTRDNPVFRFVQVQGLRKEVAPTPTSSMDGSLALPYWYLEMEDCVWAAALGPAGGLAVSPNSSLSISSTLPGAIETKSVSRLCWIFSTEGPNCSLLGKTKFIVLLHATGTFPEMCWMRSFLRVII